MEKGLKYLQNIRNRTKLPLIHLLAPKIPFPPTYWIQNILHLPIGSK